MKHILSSIVFLLGATLRLTAAPAMVGEVANDIPYAVGSATLSGNVFASVAQSNFTAHEGKIIIACYYTPW